MNIAKDIEQYENDLIDELALRTSIDNKITMLKYEMRVLSNKAPRVIMNDIKVLVAEKYLIAVEDER